MAFELFGLGKKKSVESTESAEPQLPTMEKMEEHAKKHAEEQGPAVFKGSEDLDPNVEDKTPKEVDWLQGNREKTMFHREHRDGGAV